MISKVILVLTTENESISKLQYSSYVQARPAKPITSVVAIQTGDFKFATATTRTYFTEVRISTRLAKK